MCDVDEIIVLHTNRQLGASEVEVFYDATLRYYNITEDLSEVLMDPFFYNFVAIFCLCLYYNKSYKFIFYLKY